MKTMIASKLQIGDVILSYGREYTINALDVQGTWEDHCIQGWTYGSEILIAPSTRVKIVSLVSRQETTTEQNEVKPKNIIGAIFEQRLTLQNGDIFVFLTWENGDGTEENGDRFMTRIVCDTQLFIVEKPHKNERAASRYVNARIKQIVAENTAL